MFRTIAEIVNQGSQRPIYKPKDLQIKNRGGPKDYVFTFRASVEHKISNGFG